MTGSYSGVIGMNKKDVIARFTTAIARRAEHSTEQVRICAVLLSISTRSLEKRDGLSDSISRMSSRISGQWSVVSVQFKSVTCKGLDCS